MVFWVFLVLKDYPSLLHLPLIYHPNGVAVAVGVELKQQFSDGRAAAEGRGSRRFLLSGFF